MPGIAASPASFRRPLLPLLIAFALGIALAPRLPAGPLPQAWPYLLAAAIALALWLAGRRGRAVLTLPPALLVAAGIAAGQATLHPQPAAGDISRLSGERLLVTGTVASAEQRSSGANRLLVEVTGAEDDHGQPLAASGRLLVWARGEAPGLPEPGSRIRFPAHPLPIRGYRNPGCFDVADWYARQGVFSRANVALARIETLGAPASLSSYPARLRYRVARLFDQRIGGPAGGLCAALATGSRAGLPRSVQEAFAASGTAHLLAVSGLHLGLVGLLAFWLLRRLVARWEWLLLRVPAQHVAAAGALLVVLLYALLVGWKAPPVRSALMAGAALAVLLLGRETDLLSALALAAFIILALAPYSLFEASFQLSFAAVAGIILVCDPLRARLRGLPRPAAWLLGLLAVSVAATLATAPLVAHHFNQLSLIGPLANVALVPLVGLALTPLCLAAALLVPLSARLAAVPLAVAGPLAHLSLSAVSWLGGLPWASVWVRTPDAGEVALLYAALLAIVWLRGRRLALALALALVVVAWPLYGHWADGRANPPGRLSVRYLDVGRGNSALLVGPEGGATLIDAAGLVGSDFDLGRAVIARTLWAERISRLERVAISHSHPDHAAGLPFVLAHFRPRELWLASPDAALERQAAAAGCRVMRLRAGDRRRAGRLDFDVLWPPGEPPAPPGKDWDEENEHSMVVRVAFAGRSFLFPGDIGKKSELALVAGGLRLASDVLLAPHHGSARSNSAEFLAAVAPQAVVLSRGPGSYRWPSRQVMARFAAARAAVWRTDQAGMITAATDGKKISLSGWAAPAPARGATP